MQGSFDDLGAIEIPSGELGSPADRAAKSGEGRSRRSFLRRSAVAAAVPSAVLAGASTALASNSNQSLPYQDDKNWLKNHLQEIVTNENTHLTFLLSEMGALARPQPTFQNITPGNLLQFLQMGALFCGTGAGAYVGAAPYISNKALLLQTGAIGTVEQTQAGYLNSLLDKTFVDGGVAFTPYLTLQQVIDRASPFIASLNGGPPIGFSTTDLSFDNDIAIVNTALVLEYLEHVFYNTYFPKFFP